MATLPMWWWGVNYWGAAVTTEQVEKEEGENTGRRKIKNNVK